jgi:hypothetical protein
LELALEQGVESVSKLVMLPLWVVGLSLPMSPPASFHTRAAPATRLAPHPVASPSKTHWDSRGPSSRLLPKQQPLPDFLSWFPQRTPLCRHPLRVSSPGCPGPESATSRTRSVLAVSHDFDGLLRTEHCGFVAPRYRPWGSPGFELTADVSAERPTLLRGEYTLRSFPLTGIGFPCHQGPSPLVVGSAFTEVPTSPDLRGLSRRRVRCSTPMLPSTPCPLLPWAFAPTSSFRCRTRGSLPAHIASTEALAARHRSGRSARRPSDDPVLRQGPWPPKR